MEELEAIKEAEEAALAEAEAAAAEAAEAMELFFDNDLGGGGGGANNNDPPPEPPGGGGADEGDSPGTAAGGHDNPIIDVTNNGAGAGAGSQAGHESPISMSVLPRIRPDIYRSLETGVNNNSPYHHHHHHSSRNRLPHGHDHQSSSEITDDLDNHERMSNRSASLSGRHLHKSEASLVTNGSSSIRVINSATCGGASGAGAGSINLGSLPATPAMGPRRTSKSNSFSSHVRLQGLQEKYGNSKKPLVLFTYLDAQEHLPYADDSTAVTPKSELNGGIVVDETPSRSCRRKYSYSSHTGRVAEGSYTSHTDLRYERTRECALRSKMMNAMFSAAAAAATNTNVPSTSTATDFGGNNNNDNSIIINKPSTPNSILMEPFSSNPYGPMSASGSPRPRPPPLSSAAAFGSNGKNQDSIDINVSASFPYLLY